MPVVVRLHDHAADNVGGHQVRRELDSRIAQAECARQCAQQSSLTQTGNALQQHMPPAQQANQDAIHYALLADDNLCDLVAHPVLVSLPPERRLLRWA